MGGEGGGGGGIKLACAIETVSGLTTFILAHHWYLNFNNGLLKKEVYFTLTLEIWITTYYNYVHSAAKIKVSEHYYVSKCSISIS